MSWNKLFPLSRTALPQAQRTGLPLIAAAVAALAVLGWAAWPLARDDAALGLAREALATAGLAAWWAPLLWGLACLASLVLLWRAHPGGRRAVGAAVLAGALLGSSRLAGGGAAGALALLVATGVATLGWQTLRQGGLTLLLAAAAGTAAWDAAVPAEWPLWPACAAVVAVFAWIERQHLRAAERQLAAASAERADLNDGLRAQREQALRLQQQRTQMLSGIAHSLRQPLWAISLYTDTLLRRTQSAESAELLQRQASAVAEASGMLDQFSHLAALERGLLAMRPEAVDVRELLLSVVSELAAAQRPPVPTIRVHGRHRLLRTDRTHLGHIVHTLAQHAVRQAVAARGERARVVLAVRPLHGGCAIDVLDNGQGIAPERLAQVFEPYAPLQANANSGRQGLSLTIAQGLASALGLTIEVRSVPEHGTRFRVCVPAALC
ncbi:MAG: HAMP domain-containing sensor histidine kinase [Pseudomonadota bacterium]